jgi:hypothetical protein
MTFQIKGVRNGLLVTMPEGAWQNLQEELINQMQEQAAFYKGAKLALAEIIAGGSVMVWGTLRGVVPAGADGDDQSQVYAIEMSPAQLRIANHNAVAPKRGKEKPAPEIARLHDGRVVVYSWEAKEAL